ncbi:hypothetical protein [Mesoflavibacter zeaxanthinifaciens]|uniref:hypothetical protein n=1 Tax=Mesoflavibacter zeaxanthinifaciens TaxID=393060 RepID=UPI003A8F2133
MKKLTLLLISFSFMITSCSVEDDTPTENYHIEILPVESATVPESFTYGEDHEITVSYIRPSTCYEFNDIYFLKNNNVRNVAVMTTVWDNVVNCVDLQSIEEKTFTVKATQLENYIFKFWQGVDDSGEDIYLTVEVPVEQ